MIVWLNGPFGAGKSTVADLMMKERLSLTVFDTEAIGYMLRPILSARHPAKDFQDWPAWREIVVASVAALDSQLEGDLVVPQTVVIEPYWRQIVTGLQSAGVDIATFTLDVDPVEHERRIAHDRRDRGAARWRRERRADYDDARPWLAQATTMLDTTTMSAGEVAHAVLDKVSLRR